jgi:hypothetical protein
LPLGGRGDLLGLHLDADALLSLPPLPFSSHASVFLPERVSELAAMDAA